MENKDFWPLIESTTFAFGPFYQEKMSDAIEETGVADTWFTLSLVRGADPESFDLARYQGADPYTHASSLAETLEQLAEQGLLQQNGDLSFHLSDRGREAIGNVFAAAHRALAEVSPLPETELEEVTALLARVVDNALAATQPENKWGLQYSRWTDPGLEASPAARIDQYLTDLLRYRDDCHIAAWTGHGLTGPAQEALAHIWQEGPSTPDGLGEALSFRAVPAAEYAQALQHLVDRGWVLSDGDAYSITDEGKQARQAIEAETGRLFHSPFAPLSPPESARLEALLQRLSKNLQHKGRLKVLDLMQGDSTAISQAGRQAVESILDRRGLNEPGFLFILFRALQRDPQPISVESIDRQSPYSNPELHRGRLERVAEAGFLATLGDGEYRITREGREAVEEVNNAFYLLLGELPVLNPERIDALEGLFGRLVESSLNAQEPEDKMRLNLVHNAHPEKSYGTLAQVDQHLDDLLAFRDDVHLASWRGQGVSPRAWEALTLVWRGKAADAAGLVEELPGRGYEAADYDAALQELVSRGWLEGGEAGFRVTRSGDAVRGQAEDETNRLFFTPWEVLSQQEVNRLHFLLARLERDIKELETSRERTT